MTPFKSLLPAALCVLLGACGGPAVSLKYEQRYTVRDEERLFYWVKHPVMSDMPVVCIPWTGMERLPKCSQPWEDLFYVEPWLEPHPYLQGQSTIESLGANGTARLRPLCSDTVQQFQISRAERRAIGAAAQESGFFDFPADLSELAKRPRAAGDESDVIIAPRYTCATSNLELEVDGRHNRVRWNCETALALNQDDATAPRQMQRLLAAIEKAYAAHSLVSVMLPYARCPTLEEELVRREAAQQP